MMPRAAACQGRRPFLWGDKSGSQFANQAKMTRVKLTLLESSRQCGKKRMIDKSRVVLL
jgi:hypothetical protein